MRSLNNHVNSLINHRCEEVAVLLQTPALAKPVMHHLWLVYELIEHLTLIASSLHLTALHGWFRVVGLGCEGSDPLIVKSGWLYFSRFCFTHGACLISKRRNIMCFSYDFATKL